MEFILRFAISIFPFVCGLVIFFKDNNVLTRSIAYFLFLLSVWQVDISFLYAEKLLNESTIDVIFRVLRIGPIMIMALMHYFTSYLFKHVIDTEVITFKRLYKVLLYKFSFFLLFSYSIVTYIINWTPYGVETLTYVYNSGLVFVLSHFIPSYGSLHFMYIINVLLTKN